MNYLIKKSEGFGNHWRLSVLPICLIVLGVTMLLAAQIQTIPNLPGPLGGDSAGAPVVKIELAPQFQPAAVGQSLTLAVVLTVPEGWHLYANPKQGEFGKDTRIIPQPVKGARFGNIIYDPGKKYVDANFKASNQIYEGAVVCYVPLEVAADAPPEGVISIQLKLDGLLCSDAGQCRPWQEQAVLDLRLTARSEQAQMQRPKLFEKINLPQAWRDSTAQIEPSARPEGTTTAKEDIQFASDEWIWPILTALGAGLIMNLMPCVLPIIPIVVMTLMNRCATEDGRPDRGKSIRVGLAFAAGILIVFAGLAIVMSGFKLIWGQHFQSNAFKFVLLMIVYILSLSMFGLFEIVLPARVSNLSVSRQGYLGALGMGMLTTVLATPCGAPLLTPVLAWSLSKPMVMMVAVFLIIGTGMALPYVILTAFPKLLNRIPKGGNWMIRLKHIIGFAMLAFTIYIIGLFPPGWQGPLYYYCLLLGFCVWLGLSVMNRTTPAGRRWAFRSMAVLMVIAGSVLLARAPKSSPTSAGENWLTSLNQSRQQGRTVIVKFTANWCKNCAVLDKIIYKTQIFKDKLKETNADLVVVDWSFDDPTIKQMISDLGGPGQALPFAVVFPGGDPEHPILLRDFYSMEDVLKALDEAAGRILSAPNPEKNN